MTVGRDTSETLPEQLADDTVYIRPNPEAMSTTGGRPSADVYYGAVAAADRSEQFVDVVGLDDRPHRVRLVRHLEVVEGRDGLGDLARPDSQRERRRAEIPGVYFDCRPICVPSVEIATIVTGCSRDRTGAARRRSRVRVRRTGDDAVPRQSLLGSPQATTASTGHGDQSSDAKLFVESSHSQARTIAMQTNKPVYSKEQNRMLQQGYLNRVTRNGQMSIEAVKSDPLRYVEQFRSDPVDFVKRASSVFLDVQRSPPVLRWAETTNHETPVSPTMDSGPLAETTYSSPERVRVSARRPPGSWPRRG